MADRTPLFSLTYQDFSWDFSRGSGKGGQHRNKTDSKARCRHVASGAEGVDESQRSQGQNKRLAFEKCVRSEKFQTWLRIECARRLGQAVDVEAVVDQLMKAVKVEVHDEAGRWVPAPAVLEGEDGRGR